MKSIGTKHFALFLLFVASLSAHAQAPAQKIPCQLKAFNSGMDENFKTPEPDLIRKTYIFDPTNLSENSAYMGILLPKGDFKNASVDDLRVEVQLVKQRLDKKSSLIHSKSHKVEEFSENSDYYLVSDFSPSDVLKTKNKKRPTKIVLIVLLNQKELCQQSIKVDEADSI